MDTAISELLKHNLLSISTNHNNRPCAGVGITRITTNESLRRFPSTVITARLTALTATASEHNYAQSAFAHQNDIQRSQC